MYIIKDQFGRAVLYFMEEDFTHYVNIGKGALKLYVLK